MSNERPKILAISYLFPNSQDSNHGIFVLNRLKAASKYCDIIVINPIPWFPFSTILKRYKKYRDVPKLESIQGLEVHHPRFVSLPGRLKIIEPITLFFSLLFSIQKVKRSFSFHILDVHWLFPELPAVSLLAYIFRKKLIATLRGKEALFAAGMWKYKYLLVPSLNRADYVISLSTELEDLSHQGGVKHDRFAIIRNGADTDKFCFLDQKVVRAQLRIAENTVVILSVGSLIRRKGFDRVITALPALLVTYPQIVYYIIGSSGPDGDVSKELYNLVRDKNLSNHVKFMGDVDNSKLIAWYNAADLFCLASRGEGSPNVLSEALTCGCPAVSTDVGSAHEILAEDWMGVIVKNKDDAIFPGLLTALNLKYDRRRIADHMARFDWDWCARQVVKIYYITREG